MTIDGGFAFAGAEPVDAGAGGFTTGFVIAVGVGLGVGNTGGGSGSPSSRALNGSRAACWFALVTTCELTGCWRASATAPNPVATAAAMRTAPNHEASRMADGVV